MHHNDNAGAPWAWSLLLLAGLFEVGWAVWSHRQNSAIIIAIFTGRRLPRRSQMAPDAQLSFDSELVGLGGSLVRLRTAAVTLYSDPVFSC
jgi:hypothetical protein